AASRAAHTKERRRRRFVAGGVGFLGLVAAVVAAVAVTARGQAEEQHRLADDNRRLANKNRELVAQSYMEAGRQLVVGGYYQEAVPYLLAARQRGVDSPPLRMLFWEAKRHLPIIPAL